MSLLEVLVDFPDHSELVSKSFTFKVTLTWLSANPEQSGPYSGGPCKCYKIIILKLTWNFQSANPFASSGVTQQRQNQFGLLDWVNEAFRLILTCFYLIHIFIYFQHMISNDTIKHDSLFLQFVPLKCHKTLRFWWLWNFEPRETVFYVIVRLK